MNKGGLHMGVKVMFPSVILDGEIKFGKAVNNCDTASFCVKYENEKYRMILFSDQNEKNPYTRMKTCVEKSTLSKGTPLWIEAEMTYYEKSIIPDELWDALVKKASAETVKSMFGSTQNPSKGKFPRFKVTDWNFAIPREYHDSHKKDTSVEKENQPIITPLNLNNWGTQEVEEPC